jgi:hypothetical protein
LSVHTEDILRDPSQIKEIINHGLIAFCWGDDNNDAATIQYLKKLGLHGVIYDRIVEHIPEKKSIFFTEHQYELLQIAATSPEAEIQDSSTSFDFGSLRSLDDNDGKSVNGNGKLGSTSYAGEFSNGNGISNGNGNGLSTGSALS